MKSDGEFKEMAWHDDDRGYPEEVAIMAKAAYHAGRASMGEDVRREIIALHDEGVSNKTNFTLSVCIKVIEKLMEAEHEHDPKST